MHRTDAHGRLIPLEKGTVDQALRVARLPDGTDYLREHILWGFQQDIGVRLRDLMGVDKLIWATDFPYQESEYPHSHTVIGKNFAGMPDDET